MEAIQSDDETQTRLNFVLPKSGDLSNAVPICALRWLVGRKESIHPLAYKKTKNKIGQDYFWGAILKMDDLRAGRVSLGT